MSIMIIIVDDDNNGDDNDDEDSNNVNLGGRLGQVSKRSWNVKVGDNYGLNILYLCITLPMNKTKMRYYRTSLRDMK